MANEVRPRTGTGLGRFLMVLGTVSVVAGLGLVARMVPGSTVVSPSQGADQNQESDQAAADDGDGHDDSDGHSHGEISDDDHASVLAHQTRFTSPGEGWPPRPVNATDRIEADLAAVASPEDRLEAHEAANPAGQGLSRIFLRDPDVAEALGDDYTLVGFETAETGGKGRSGAVLVYFSRTNNRTVRGVIDNGRITDLTISEAGEFQPALLPEEVEEAVTIARDHWRQQGEAQIDELVGYGILAFQPSGAYYDTRMVYVSFHVDLDARPELLAWVDLSRGLVEHAEVDR